MTQQEILSSMQTGVVHWLPFRKEQRICVVMGGDGTFLEDVRNSVYAWLSAEDYTVSKSEAEPEGKYDVILLIGILEITGDVTSLLSKCRECLEDDGYLVIGMNNSFGVRYFIGDKDPFTGRVFDSICRYEGCNPRFLKGRSLTDSELAGSLAKIGFDKTQCKRFSLFSGIENVQFIYSENTLPNENLNFRYFPTYWNPESIFLGELWLLPQLAENDLFHPMANAYVYVCAKEKLPADISDIESATVALDRGPVNSGITVIRNGQQHTVEKYPAYSAGEERLKNIIKNEELLSELGFNVIRGEWKEGRYVAPFVENGENGVDYFVRLVENDKEAFLEACDRFRDILYKAPAFYDLTPWNCFVIDNEFIFFDQEYYDSDFQADVLLYRSLICWSSIGYKYGFTMDSLLERYGLAGQEKRLGREMEKRINNDLRNLDIMADFWRERTIRTVPVGDNRDRINYPGLSYEDRFKLPSPNVSNKKTYLFGSGLFASKFINRYGEIYDISGILDNNPEKWGQMLDEYRILQPETLKELKKEDTRVIICVRRHAEILEQVKSYGISETYLFDPSVSRIMEDESAPEISAADEIPAEEKKYHIGYVAGVFDLFHIGHLNLLRRAKEHCDHLIVGVVSDEGVRKFKQVEPYIPFEERLEIVRACKYVDEAHKIPFLAGGSIDAWNLYHFDVQFSGSDYVKDGYWLDERERLRKVGADIVFFPYTESTSSTKLKEKIDHG